MKEYKIENIRNIGIVAHGGAGKTSLSEAILFNSKTIDKLGKVLDGSTVMDYEPDEIERQGDGWGCCNCECNIRCEA